LINALINVNFKRGSKKKRIRAIKGGEGEYPFWILLCLFLLWLISILGKNH